MVVTNDRFRDTARFFYSAALQDNRIDHFGRIGEFFCGLDMNASTDLRLDTNGRGKSDSV